MAILCFRLRDIDYYPQEEWDIGSVLAKRRWLIKTLPINSSEITKLDEWLVKQPDLHPDDMLDIWSRTLYCFWLAYRDPEIDKLTKHLILLAFKEEFEEFCCLSEFDQERLWPNWSIWRATFLTEEGIARYRAPTRPLQLGTLE